MFRRRPTGGRRRAVVVHPSAELYGSDRVALESTAALVEAGWTVTVALANEGPLRQHLEKAGAHVVVTAAPVLRKSLLSPAGVARFTAETARRTPAMLRLLRDVDAELVYVSTVTVPWWLVLARLRRARVVCHVHEAEDAVPRAVRTALAVPLLLARPVIANSAVSRDIIVRDVPALRSRTVVVYNGVPGPEQVRPPRVELADGVRLVLVGRVSPRKGTDVAVAALALLWQAGTAATLDVVGGVFPGYEWFEEQVRAEADRAGVADQVRWRGVLPDVWAALNEADIALVPSRVEPFGNAAVEAMLAERPVVAGDTQGLREIVRPGDNGELVATGDPQALATAISTLVADWPAARERAAHARTEAVERFSVQRYRADLVARVAPVRELH